MGLGYAHDLAENWRSAIGTHFHPRSHQAPPTWDVMKTPLQLVSASSALDLETRSVQSGNVSGQRPCRACPCRPAADPPQRPCDEPSATTRPGFDAARRCYRIVRGDGPEEVRVLTRKSLIGQPNKP